MPGKKTLETVVADGTNKVISHLNEIIPVSAADAEARSRFLTGMLTKVLTEVAEGGAQVLGSVKKPRPPNAYQMYIKYLRTQAKEEEEKVKAGLLASSQLNDYISSHGGLFKFAAEQWRNMDAAARAPYATMADNECATKGIVRKEKSSGAQRAPTGYNLFVRHISELREKHNTNAASLTPVEASEVASFEAAKAENGGKSQAAFSALWKALGDAGQKSYNDQAAAGKDQWNREHGIVEATATEAAPVAAPVAATAAFAGGVPSFAAGGFTIPQAQ